MSESNDDGSGPAEAASQQNQQSSAATMIQIMEKAQKLRRQKAVLAHTVQPPGAATSTSQLYCESFRASKNRIERRWANDVET